MPLRVLGGPDPDRGVALPDWAGAARYAWFPSRSLALACRNRDLENHVEIIAADLETGRSTAWEAVVDLGGVKLRALPQAQPDTEAERAPVGRPGAPR